MLVLPPCSPVSTRAVNPRLHHPGRRASKCKLNVTATAASLVLQSVLPLSVLLDNRLFTLKLRLLYLLPPLLHSLSTIHVLHSQLFYMSSSFHLLLFSELLSLKSMLLEVLQFSSPVIFLLLLQPPNSLFSLSLLGCNICSTWNTTLMTSQTQDSIIYYF